MEAVMVGAWTLVVLAVAFFGVAMWSVVVAQRPSTWAPVSARVVRSQVEYRGEEFAADIAYTYSFGGEEYAGSTAGSFQVVYNWRGPAERKCARYPDGATVTVFVDPRDPKRSMLEAPPRGAALVFLFVSIVFFLIGMALM
jgi:regulation of enolase protein 1 (concanavalin A-like superfamily)